MKKILALAALSAALFAGSAAAQMYVGAGLGEARPDNGDASWKVYGGVQLTPMLGVELGYLNLGKNRGSEFDAWSLAGTGTFALDDRWALIGKVGGASLRTNGVDETNLLLGAGVSFAMNKNFGLRLEYEDFGRIYEFAPGDDARTQNLGLSVRYLF